MGYNRAATDLEKARMQLGSEPAKTPRESATTSARTDADLPLDRMELEKLSRWVPAKEMALLVEICQRAHCDPELTRPALLLCLAYIDRVARMLDQDPIPNVTERVKDQLQRLRERQGL
jgi:hypothetical protein